MIDFLKTWCEIKNQIKNQIIKLIFAPKSIVSKFFL